MRMSARVPFALLLASIFLSAASYLPAGPQSAAAGAPGTPIGKPVRIEAPLGFPAVPIPPDNPPTEETIALGRRLYYLNPS